MGEDLQGKEESLNLIYPFVYAMLVSPVSTAEVERGFSVERCIKTKLRNRLKISTLDSLLRVKQLAPAMLDDFDMAAAVRLFDSDSNASLLNKLHAAVGESVLPTFEADFEEDVDFYFGDSSDSEGTISECFADDGFDDEGCVTSSSNVQQTAAALEDSAAAIDDRDILNDLDLGI